MCGRRIFQPGPHLCPGYQPVSYTHLGEGARVSYSVLLPGTVVEPGAVVEYAILGEDCRIGRNCRVGGAPESVAEGGTWGLTVLAPGCQLEAERQVAPGAMLDRSGEEVSK